MPDYIRPLKIENPVSGGTETDFYPTEADPTEDYLAAKGIGFNGDQAFAIDHVGRTLAQKEPFTTFAITYLANGEVDYIDYFNSNTQITANRVYKTTMAYDGNLNPTSATTVIYNTNGTTILRTITETYSYSGADISSGTVTS